MNNLTFPKGIELPQQSPLASLLGGIGSGIQTAAPSLLQQLLLQPQQRAEAQQEQQRSEILGRHADLTPEEARQLKPGDISQLIRSRAEEKKALVKQAAAQTQERQKFAFQRAGKILDRNEEIKETLPLQ
jgi:hypothetical protein